MFACFLQGYLIYSVKQKLKQEYVGLSGNEIKNLKSSGVEVSLNYCSNQGFGKLIFDKFNNLRFVSTNINVLNLLFYNRNLVSLFGRNRVKPKLQR